MTQDDQRPVPLVPAEVDLRDFSFMPLHVQRLRDSELVDLATGDEFKAAVLLWCYAWHQQPASSLPNDDRILAARSGAGPAWRKVKDMALRGFIECSDGRLYHPLIAEAAIDAWARRDAYQERHANRETRQQRWRAELARLSALLRASGVTLPARPTKRALVDMCRLHVPGFVDADVDARETQRDISSETRDRLGEIAKTGTGTGTETIKPNTRSGTAETVARVLGDVDDPPDRPEPPPQPPTRAGALCLAMRRAGIGACNPGHPDLLALIAAGVTDAEVVGAAEAAVRRGKGFAYAIGTLVRQRQEAAQGLHHGPMPPTPAAGRQARQLATAGALVRGGMGPLPSTPPPQPEAIDVESRTIAP